MRTGSDAAAGSGRAGYGIANTAAAAAAAAVVVVVVIII